MDVFTVVLGYFASLNFQIPTIFGLVSWLFPSGLQKLVNHKKCEKNQQQIKQGKDPALEVSIYQNTNVSFVKNNKDNIVSILGHCIRCDKNNLTKQCF